MTRQFGDAVEQAHMLQRSIGNQATLRLLAQRATSFTGYQPHVHNKQEVEPASLIVQGTTPGVSWDFGKIPLFPPDRGDQQRAQVRLSGPPVPGVIQPKLAVGEVNDPLEHCEKAENCRQPAVESLHSHATGPGPAAAPANVHEVLQSQGQPLPIDVRLHDRPGRLTSAEAAERHAVTVSEGSVAPAVAPAAPPSDETTGLPGAGGLIELNRVTVDHERVTVPPVAGLKFSATKIPTNASGVTLSIVGDNATIAAGTTVNNTTGAITVAAGQTGGSAHVEAKQNATGAGGATILSTSPSTAPFNFTAIPSGITSTAASPGGPPDSYGGKFTHTFTSPAGGQTALERSHVNEQFAGATGTNLTITGNLGPLQVHINNPGLAAAGWDLDSSGTMLGPDLVNWAYTIDARPFVANASHPSPSPGLPQELTATQNFRNLTFPPRTYGAAVVASTTHRRAIEDRNNQLKAVTSAGINQEVVEDYMGPTVFRRCVASPASIPVAAPAPPGAKAPAASTSTITVDAEGEPAKPAFSLRPPALGCRITQNGVLTPGTTPGTVTVRAGNTANFDETTVTLTPQPATPPRP